MTVETAVLREGDYAMETISISAPKSRCVWNKTTKIVTAVGSVLMGLLIIGLIAWNLSSTDNGVDEILNAIGKPGDPGVDGGAAGLQLKGRDATSDHIEPSGLHYYINEHIFGVKTKITEEIDALGTAIDEEVSSLAGSIAGITKIIGNNPDSGEPTGLYSHITETFTKLDNVVNDIKTTVEIDNRSKDFIKMFFLDDYEKIGGLFPPIPVKTKVETVGGYSICDERYVLCAKSVCVLMDSLGFVKGRDNKGNEVDIYLTYSSGELKAQVMDSSWGMDTAVIEVPEDNAGIKLTVNNLDYILISDDIGLPDNADIIVYDGNEVTSIRYKYNNKNNIFVTTDSPNLSGSPIQYLTYTLDIPDIEENAYSKLSYYLITGEILNFKIIIKEVK